MLTYVINGSYEGESISNQPIPFPMDRDGHDFHALFQYMIYTWVQFFSSGLMAPEHCWSKCITQEGNYIEKKRGGSQLEIS